MGASGPQIFDDDVAWDVRAAFLRDLSTGSDVQSATSRVLSTFQKHLNDVDDGPTVWFALALLQLDQGWLQPLVQQHVVQIIDEGGGLSRWEDATEDELLSRKRVLADVRQRVISAPREDN